LLSRPLSRQSIQWIDDISNYLCQAADVAEFCRNAHPGASWRNAANEAWRICQAGMSKHSYDSRLIKILSQIVRDKEFQVRANLSEEEIRVCRSLYLRLGATSELPTEFRDTLTQLSTELTDTEFAFTSASANVDIENPSSASGHQGFRLRGVRAEQLIGLVGQVPLQQSGNDVIVYMSPASLPHYLRTIPNAIHRRMLQDAVYESQLSMFTSETNPLNKLQQMIALRHLMARANGFSSATHSSLSELVARSPEAVIGMLLELSKRLRPVVARELEMLEKISQKSNIIDPPANPTDNIETAPDPVAPVVTDAPAQSNSSKQSWLSRTLSLFSRKVSAGLDGSGRSTSDPRYANIPADAKVVPVPVEQAAAKPVSWLGIGDGVGAGSKIGPSDLDFLMTRAYAEFVAKGQSIFSDYLALPSVLGGISRLLEHSFGVRLVMVPMTRSENWTALPINVARGQKNQKMDDASFAEQAAELLPKRAADFVYKIAVIDTEIPDDEMEKNVLGYIYYDIFARPGKFMGAATFALQCGCLRHDRPEDEISLEELVRQHNIEVTKRKERMQQKRQEAMQARAAALAAAAAEGKDPAAVPPAEDEFIIDAPTSPYHPEPTPDSELSPANVPPEAYQTPAVVVSAGFPYLLGHHMSTRVRSIGSTAPPMLTIESFHTLLHETGHALQTILSRTRLQHLSGTRGEFDCAETMSTLFERFGRDPKALSVLCTHYVTGDSMPPDLLRILANVDNLFIGIKTLQTVCQALIDQRLFGVPAAYDPDVPFPWLEPNPNAGSNDYFKQLVKPAEKPTPAVLVDKSKTAAAQESTYDPSTFPAFYIPVPPAEEHAHASPEQTTQIVAQFMRLFGPVLPPASPLPAWHATFDHFSHYGTTYYTYIFSNMISTAIWHKLFSANPLDLLNGRRLREIMLAKGGTKEPFEMLRELFATVEADQQAGLRPGTATEAWHRRRMMLRNPTTVRLPNPVKFDQELTQEERTRMMEEFLNIYVQDIEKSSAAALAQLQRRLDEV